MNIEKSPPRSQAALRRLVIVIAIIIGVIIYSYGFAETQIDLEKPQEPVRQAQVQRALRELLSPRIFSQNLQTNDNVAVANFGMGCPKDNSPIQQPDHPAGQPYITLSPECGKSGDPLTIQGFNFQPNAILNLYWVFPNGDPNKQLATLGTPSGATNLSIDTDSSGQFSVQVPVPKPGAGGADKIHQVSIQSTTVSSVYLSDTTNDVLSKMVETVFLALVATTIAIPFSVLVSFLAAHNLMRPIQIMMGSLLVGFILLPVGWWIGVNLLAPLGTIAVNLGKGHYFGLASIVPIGFMFMSAVGARAFQLNEAEDLNRQMRSVLNTILFAIAFMLILGLVGGVMLWIGRLFNEGVLGMVSGFFHILGRLIELLVPLFAGLITAFTLMSIGIRVATKPMRAVAVIPDHIIGGLLGAVSGGLLLYGIATLGSEASLLGLLPPIIAGVLGASFLPLFYQRVTSQAALKPGETASLTQNSVNRLLSIIGGVAAFAVTFLLLSVQSAIVAVDLPDLTNPLDPHLLTAAAIGAILAGGIGLMSGARANLPVGEMVYNVTRTILNILRSIEPLIMGLVFVSWVGIGPFAGLLALTLHSIASLGKLYSEQIESIDAGPIEAIQATGANRLQMIIYAVVPQIIPPYISFTMYRWDTNVRMSTIIGFVGGGGIGFLLLQQINLLQYRDAGVSVLAIAVVVSILDYASAVVRERVV